MGSAHPLSHQLIQRLHEIGHIAAPDRLRGSRDLEALPCSATLGKVSSILVPAHKRT
jgi:hypothetical protein